MQAAIVVGGPDGPTLEIVEVPDPVPGPDDLLIAIRAAALNRTDLRRTQQHFSQQGAHIAGLEMAGEVIGMGANVSGWAIGDRAMAMASASYAERTVVDYRLALKVPAHLSWPQAAALPTAFLTAHDALVTAGGLRPGASVLVHAAGSAVGIVAVQVARALGAGLVLGTSRGSNRFAQLYALGMDQGIATGDEDFVAAVMRHTDGKGADVIIDMIGGGVLAGNLACAALGGRIVSVGRMGGMTDTIDLDQLALKRLALVGVTFRSRTVEQKAALHERMLRDLGPLLEDGSLVPLIDRVFPLADVLDAQEYMRSNAHFGKIIVQP